MGDINTTNMYEPVIRNEGKGRRFGDKKILITIIIVGMFFIGMIFSFWWYMSYWKRYANLSSELSAATTFAYAHDSANVKIGGETYKIKPENAYEVYQCVCVYGPGRERFRSPEGDAAEIDYGNGARLELIQKDGRLYFCFFGSTGFEHIFYTSDIDLDYLVTRYLAPDKQG
ncbi:MAG: hypothetical protein IJL83_06375 [Clostridia bacterium]|nr:hypothetical protein [Clostridia bacterium]